MAPRRPDPAPSDRRHLVIRASAGTGKTFQLSLRYVDLMLRGVPPDRILATTFTRKAAGEILQRIVERLAEAALDEKCCRELAAHLGTPQLRRDRCLATLQSLLSTLHRLRISTLDSLFAQLARAFSLDIGLPTGWRILDEAEELDLRDAAIEAVLHGAETARVLSLTHLLTKGEAVRGVNQLIRDTIASLHGLYRESEEAAWRGIPRPSLLSPDEWLGVLDELRGLALPDQRLMKAVAADGERAEQGDWDGLLAKGLAAKIAAGDATYYRKPIPAEVCEVYRRLLEHVRAVVTQRVANQTETSYELLRHFDTERRRLQLEQRGLRFDDITDALDVALRGEGGEDRPQGAEGPASGSRRVTSQASLVHRLDGQVSHLLLDEFQDTSPRQWRALQGFVEGVTGDREGSFFCVGDVKQAIYGWRGGVAEIFSAAEAQIPGVERRQLNQSFRSSCGVIEFVNRVFQGAMRHPQLERACEAVETWCRGFEEHSTTHQDWTGYACLRSAAAPGDGQSAREVVLEAAVELVAGLHAASPAGEIGVLVRRNATVAHLVHLLRQRGLPASEEGGNPLTDSAAVQLVLSALRLADHPGDTVARFHVAASPLAGELGITAHDDDPAALAAASRIRDTLQVRGYGEFVARCAAILRSHGSRRDAKRLDQLVERACAFQRQATLRARDFIRKTELERVAEPSRALIRVMTIHQAKGLEFDHVVLPELDEKLIGQPPKFVIERRHPAAPISCVCLYVNQHVQQLLPVRLQRMFHRATQDDVCEAMCLLYVALTRAVHSLHVLIPPSGKPDEKVPCSLAGIVRAALVGEQPVAAASVLYECGDPRWTGPPEPAASETAGAGSQTAGDRAVPGQRAEPAPAAALFPRGARTEEESIRLAPSDRRERGLERLSPSGLEGGSRVQLRARLQSGTSGASLRGTILHACLAQIQWLDDARPDDRRIRGVIAEVLRAQGQAGNVSEWLAEFHTLLGQPLLETALCRAAYRQPERLGFAPPVARELQRPDVSPHVETEWPFAVRLPQGLLSGSIDRLVWLQSGERIVAADIIDFKTDVVPDSAGDALQQRVDYYRPQLAAYRQAVARLTGLAEDRIAARLLFLAIGRGVIVP